MTNLTSNSNLGWEVAGGNKRNTLTKKTTDQTKSASKLSGVATNGKSSETLRKSACTYLREIIAKKAV